MLGHRQFTWEDYQAVWHRRRWLVLVPLLVGPVLLFAISWFLPNRYESDTLVLIQGQRIPNTMVQSIVTEDLNARVASLEEQVLSRTRLESIIRRYNLFKENGSDAPMELLVDELRKDIELTPVKPIVKGRDQNLPGFSIGVTLSSPTLAQQVCAEVTSMFIEENLRQREQAARGTTSFFQTQLDEAKRQLDDQNAKLAEFKRQHLRDLPDDSQANFNLLASTNSQLDAVTQALGRAQQDKTYTESLLAQQVAAWKAAQASAGEDKSQTEILEQQLTSMQNQLVTLEVQDTPDHPDVIKLKSQIEEVKAKLHGPAAGPETKADADSRRPSPNEPPQLQQLRSQVHAYEDAIKTDTRVQQRLQEQIEALQSRVQMSPVVEQQYKEITLGHQTALDFYNDLLKKRNESEMATDLEQRQQGEQMIIMDPANTPKDPTFPNRPLFALAGLGGGLALGFCLGWFVEMRDKTLRDEKDIEACLGLPTLAMVPAIDSIPAKRRYSRGAPAKPVRREGRIGV